jgi:hypothetical protein
MREQNWNYTDDIWNKSKEATEELLPTKFGDRYKNVFQNFNDCNVKQLII